jgi:16S rRNA (cytosine1402-N4)-methyltransferase
MATDDAPPVTHTRRPRYSGRNPRDFAHKYKELNPDKYADEVEKIRASGKTPAGTHIPILVGEVLEVTHPEPGDVVLDCTLGGGGHARALLDRIRPGGRLIGIDVDPIELARTETAMRTEGHEAPAFVARHANFASAPKILAAEGVAAADVVLADLGVSSMQLDNPARGFSYKGVGPLDMRMNPERGEPASDWLARVSEADLAQALDENADEPHAAIIAGLLKAKPLTTTHAVERVVRTGLERALPRLPKPDVKMSVRRTFQAMRIAVNDEFALLDSLLRTLPHIVAPGGRVAIITFHSGEDRRVKKAFQAGARDGTYSEVARDVIRASMEESRANRRSQPAKLRWAVRTDA